MGRRITGKNINDQINKRLPIIYKIKQINIRIKKDDTDAAK